METFWCIGTQIPVMLTAAFAQRACDLATTPGREGTRPGAVMRRTYEEMRARGMRWAERLAAIAPASRSTRPATAAAPIPNAVHEIAGRAARRTS